MTDMNEIKDTLNLEQKDMKKLPTMLNVLTILTYIGSALGILGGIYNYFTICKSAEMMDSLGGMSELSEASGALGNMMEGAMALIEKQCDNRMIILLTTIVACALCIYGAMQMRNLKKQGFSIYVIGELLVPVINIVLLGSGAMSGMLLFMGLVIPIIFIVLYFTQRKHLIH